MDPIVIRATPQARLAYENMHFHVILEILDKDVDDEEQRRPLFYNFPENFVREKQIKLDGPPVQAIFKLKRISSELSP